MLNHTATNVGFNAPSRYIINQNFQAYKGEVPSVLFPNHTLTFSYDLAFPSTNNYQVTWPLFNMAPHATRVDISTSNQTSWLTLQNTSLNLSPGPQSSTDQFIFFTVRPYLMNQKGLYKNSLIFKASLIEAPQRQASYSLPVQTYTYNSLDPVSLALAQPINNSSYQIDQIVPITLTPSSLSHPWEKINYHLISPTNFHNEFRIIAARTLAPFNVNLSFVNQEYAYAPGKYFIKAVGLSASGRTYESPVIEFNLTSTPDTTCHNPNQNPRYYCYSSSYNNRCFTGPSECSSQNKAYCCPEVKGDFDQDLDRDYSDLIHTSSKLNDVCSIFSLDIDCRFTIFDFNVFYRFFNTSP
jgi:hypothetical protein